MNPSANGQVRAHSGITKCNRSQTPTTQSLTDQFQGRTPAVRSVRLPCKALRTNSVVGLILWTGLIVSLCKQNPVYHSEQMPNTNTRGSSHSHEPSSSLEVAG